MISILVLPPWLEDKSRVTGRGIEAAATLAPHKKSKTSIRK